MRAARLALLAVVSSSLLLGSALPAAAADAASRSQAPAAAADVAPVLEASTFDEIAELVHGVMADGYGERATIQYRGSTEGLDQKLRQVFKAIGAKDDDLRFVLKKMTWNWTSTAFSATIDYRMTYWETTEQTAAVNEAARLAVDSPAIARKKEGREQVQAVYEWVIDRFRYDRTLEEHSAYAGLYGKNGTVCQGYALMLHRLLQAAGYESRIVYGTSKGDLHLWNLVRLDGAWQHLDATLDDPGAGKSKLSYFLRSDAAMAADHSWDRSAYPAASR
ncbi:hypothetical protein HGI30_07790 [Paenibacillus albicereus]|uniref:Transglutaminase-like domain-containing protein n=1 Tax=Paenibacillus albicereus TaxID=2726185 RepID=A0A6H2GVS6_9BACL|nr:transglutaminase domain-containing protein [Paenibacillus albicereus]QJC51459.1 hypothetical protein HGI30_07790 [Paenibacillus albicereus]